MAGRLCRAKSSRTRKPCQRAPIRGAVVCRTHGGAAPQVKKAAEQRIRDLDAEIADPGRVKREAACIAFSNLQELYDEKGKLLPIRQWPEEAARAVKSIKAIRGNVDKGDGKFDEVFEITLWDKPRKVENIMKHHGQLTEKVEVTGAVNVVQRLAAGRKRVAEARKRG